MKWLIISGLFFFLIIRTDEKKNNFSIIFAFSFGWNLSGLVTISALEMKIYYIHILLAKWLNDVPCLVLFVPNMNNVHTFFVKCPIIEMLLPGLAWFSHRTMNIRNGIDETCVYWLSTNNRQVIHSFYTFICRIL